MEASRRFSMAVERNYANSQFFNQNGHGAISAEAVGRAQ